MHLRSATRQGNVAFPSDLTRESSGSKLIADVLLEDDHAPVYLLVWGGPGTVARALLSIEEHFAGGPDWQCEYGL
jgi:hypothetical protein